MTRETSRGPLDCSDCSLNHTVWTGLLLPREGKIWEQYSISKKVIEKVEPRWSGAWWQDKRQLAWDETREDHTNYKGSLLPFEENRADDLLTFLPTWIIVWSCAELSPFIFKNHRLQNQDGMSSLKKKKNNTIPWGNIHGTISPQLLEAIVRRNIGYSFFNMSFLYMILKWS